MRRQEEEEKRGGGGESPMWWRNRAKWRRGDKCSWRDILKLIEVAMILASMLTTSLTLPNILEMHLQPSRPIKLLPVPSLHLHSMQDTMRGEEKRRRE